MNTHELKTISPMFQAVMDGSKTFEIRKNDRGFQTGDILNLRETKEIGGEYTGQRCMVTVTYVLSGWGIDPGCVVMAIKKNYGSLDER